jgi:hypothetical protein
MSFFLLGIVAAVVVVVATVIALAVAFASGSSGKHPADEE